MSLYLKNLIKILSIDYDTSLLVIIICNIQTLKLWISKEFIFLLVLKKKNLFHDLSVDISHK